MSIQVNGHGLAAVILLTTLWTLIVKAGDVSQRLIAYFAAVSVLYAVLIIANVDNQTGRRDHDDRVDATFRRMRVACGAHLFFFVAYAAAKAGFLVRIGYFWTFIAALAIGLAVPFMLIRRIATQVARTS